MAVCQLNSILKTAAVSVAVFALWGCERRQDGFFDAGQGGDPIWFQHFFWFFGHPEIHLPILALVLLFTGLFVRARFPKLWRGLKSIPRKAITIPGLWLSTLGFVFLLGLVQQLFWNTTYAQTVYYDTYFVVAHWHYVFSLSAVFILAAFAFWVLPKIIKSAYKLWMARICWLFAFIGTCLIIVPSILIPYRGMPLRYGETDPTLDLLNLISRIGALLWLLSFATFILVVIEALVKKRPVPHKPAHKTEDVFE